MEILTFLYVNHKAPTLAVKYQSKLYISEAFSYLCPKLRTF